MMIIICPNCGDKRVLDFEDDDADFEICNSCGCHYGDIEEDEDIEDDNEFERFN